jgi:hypothetical protein
MSFEVCYSGSSTQYRVAASTPERKGDEFYDKMDALAKEYNQLKEGADGEKEEAVNIATEAVKKALSEKYPDGRFELSYLEEDGIEDNSGDKNLEAKAEEMLELCREYFTNEAKVEGFGELGDGDGNEEFNSDGRITVDGEQIDMGKDWTWDYEHHECKFTEEREELRERDWCVSYYVGWKSSWSETIEEDKFDKEKLNWKNSIVHYGDTPIDNDIAGRRCTEESIELEVGGHVYDF